MGARLVRGLVALGFAGALAVATSTGTAYACDCAVVEPADYLHRADVAFEGTVTAIAIPPSLPGKEPSLDPIGVTFAVDATLKGVLGESVELTTAGNSAACGVVALSAGERWRIYATVVPGGGLETGSCSGDELLGHGTIPERTAAGPPVALLVAVGVTLALVAFSAWAFSRRPRGESA